MNYDSIDLDFSWDGDYAIDDDGDLKDTSYDTIKSLNNEVHTIVKSEIGEWQNYPNLGTGVSDFRGLPNTRETGERIRDRVYSRLLASGIVKGEDLDVRIVPVERHAVMIVIRVNATPTAANSLVLGEPLIISLVYDSLEDSIFFLGESQQAVAYRKG